MERLLILVAFAGHCLLPIFAIAQNAPVQLCVAGTQIQGSASSNASARDLLLKSLNKEKQDKTLTVQKVPITMSVPADALAEAKEKGCDYVVTTNETDTHTENSVMPVGGNGMVNRQTYAVAVAYKLTKVSDGSELAAGSIKGSDEGSEQNAVGVAMKKIAGKVNDAIKKAGPVAK